jgi:hypothetical protein
MIPEDRDEKGKLRVGYFIEMGMAFKAAHGRYDQKKFKLLIENAGVLKAEDWESDGSHPHTWKHRVERATQRINTGI